MATNNMGPYSTNSSTVVMATAVYLGSSIPNLNASKPSLEDGNNGLSNTPPPTGSIVVPNSPMGASTAANGFTSSWGYVNGENTTEAFLHAAYTEANWNGIRIPTNRS